MDELNNIILNLWIQNHNNLNLGIRFEGNDIQVPLLWPSCYFNPPENVQILFIGLNPSDSFPGAAGLINNNLQNPLFHNVINQDFQAALSYNHQQYTSQNIADLEEIAFHNHNYFNKFKRLGNFILNGDEENNDNQSYYHLDLYQFRLQNSNKFMLIKTNNTEFFDSQIDNSINLIRQIQPQLIFVANKNASDLISDILNLDWSIDKGCHELIGEDWNCNVFLSGMITQTRAIDDYSFQRLKWHMKSIFEERLMQNQ
ncbi:MAG: hypothetical protein M0Q41_12385 [Bacteroidales bacterium]|nr:hypothetical protein [Bacteroidales bacterium]